MTSLLIGRPWVWKPQLVQVDAFEDALNTTDKDRIERWRLRTWIADEGTHPAGLSAVLVAFEIVRFPQSQVVELLE
jgi:hypothetical protein